MVEITSLPIEGVRVGIGAVEVRDEVGEIVAGSSGIIGTGLDLINRIFLGIGVQIAHDEEVGVAATGWVGGKPIHQGFCGGSAGLAAIALTITKIRVADIVTVGTLGFEVIDHHGKARASGIDFKGLRQGRAALGINKAWIDSRGQQLEISDGVTTAGL